MRKELTELVVLMDRSGSMEPLRKDAEGGLSGLIRKQKELPGEALFTLCQFDTFYEFVHKAIPIKEVPYCKLEPRGGTALLDAVGRCIIETGDRLRKLEEKDRPGLVTFVIITDGQENSSMEFTREKIKSMIEHQQSKYSWQFIYLGANQDAFAEAGGLGISLGGTAQYSNYQNATGSASASIGRMRAAICSGAVCVNAFDAGERQAMMAP